MNKLILVGIVLSIFFGAAQAAGRKEEAMRICRDYAKDKASLLISAKKIPGKLDRLSSSQEIGSTDLIEKTAAHMLYMIRTVPSLTEKQLAASGYAYCLGQY